MNKKTIWKILVSILPITFLLRFVMSFLFFISNPDWTTPVISEAIKWVLNYILWILTLLSMPTFILGILIIAWEDYPLNEIFKKSRELTKKYIRKFIRVWILLYIANLAFDYLPILLGQLGWILPTEKISEEQLANNPSLVIILLTMSIISSFLKLPALIWSIKIYLDASLEKEFNVSNLYHYYSKDLSTVFQYILGTILSGIAVIWWLILFIIPGIIIGLRLSYVNYLIIDKRMWAVEAIKASRAMTYGHISKIAATIAWAFIINLIWLLALGIGLIRSIPTSILLSILTYRYIDNLSTTKK